MLFLLSTIIISYFNRYEIEFSNNPLCQEFQRDLQNGLKTKLFTKKDYPSISDNFYRGCDVYEEIILGEGIDLIYNYMFYGSTIKKITINENITFIGEGAFAFCTKLTSFTFKDSIQTIGDGAFYYSSLGNLTQNRIRISIASILSIGESAFEGCPLKGSTFKIPDNISQKNIIIKKRAFYGTQIKYIKISNVSKIEAYAFSNCQELKFVIGEELKVDIIGNHAFYNSTKLCSSLTIYSNYIGECAFLNTKIAIEKIEWNIENYFNQNSFVICNYAFSGITIINSINFKSNYGIYIYDYAFYQCIFRGNSDSTLFINLTNCETNSYAFSNCHFATEFILILYNTKIYSRSFEFLTGNLIIQTSSNDFKTVINEYAFQESSISLPIDKTLYINNDIGRNAFYNCKKIQGKLVINANIINPFAFFNCTNLVGPIHIKNSNIMQSAFECCKSRILGLEIINSNQRQISIYERAFYKSGLDCKLVFHSFINEIHEYAFSHCVYLKNNPITIYANKIYSNSFSNCGKLACPVTIYSRYIDFHAFFETNFDTLTISNQYSSSTDITIETQAFYSSHFSGIVKIDGNVMIKPYAFIHSIFDNDIIINTISIGPYAFYQCNTGNSINLTIGNTNIYNNAFELFGKTNGKVVLNFCNIEKFENHNFIGNSAFNESGISGNLVIPYNFNLIGNFAFFNCHAITSAEINFGKNAHSLCYSNNNYAYYTNVKSIGESAFEGCNNIVKLELKSNGAMISIGARAFYSLNIENEITLPFSVNYIGESAFEKCTKLKKFVFNYNSNLKIISDNAFRDCEFLEGEIYIPKSIEIIGKNAFRKCSNLKNLILNSNCNLKIIDDYAFYECKNLKGTLEIPRFTTKIGNYAFTNCFNIGDYVSFNSNEILCEIGNHSFEGCINLKRICQNSYNNDASTNKYQIDYRISSFGDYSFCNSGITGDFYFSPFIKSIGKYAFKGCIFNKIIFSQSIICYIKEGAFESTIINEDIFFPGNLYELGKYAFKNSKLKSITTKFIENQYLKSIEDSVFENAIIDGFICISSNFIEIKKCAFKNSIIQRLEFNNQSKLNKISESAFEGSVIKNFIDFPNNLEIIGKYAFKNSMLNGILFNNESLLNSIGESAFEGSNIKSKFYFPNLITIINYSVFKKSSLVGIQFRNESKLEVIGESAFERSTINGFLEFPHNLVKIDKYSFKKSVVGNGSFHKVKKLQEIGIAAFQHSTITADLIFYSSLMIISYNAFENCSNICNLIIEKDQIPGNNTLIIDDNSFCDSSVSGTLSIPFYVTKIGRNAFNNCHNLGEIKFENRLINNGLLSICDRAFYNSSISNKLTFPLNLKEVGNYAFANCPKLIGKITIYCGIFFRNVFENCSNVSELEMFGGYLGPYSFVGCKKFVGPISLHKKCRIGDNAFNGFQESKFNLKLTDIDYVTIGERAFYNSSITGSLDFPVDMIEIGKESFALCQFLLGDLIIDINTIGLNPFMKSTFNGNLEILYSNEHQIKNCFEKYFKQSSGFKNLKIGAVKSSSLSIPPYAFSGMNQIEGKITLSSSICSIGKYAFSDCYFYKIEFENKIVIKEGAFYNCPNINTTIDLSNFYIEKANYEIPSRLFYGCSKLPSIIFPSSVERIGNEAFSGCFSLSFHLDFFANINHIGKSAFYRCLSLKGSLEISQNTKYIAENAFYGCTGLSGSLTIHVGSFKKPTFIGPFAFKYCTGFKNGKLFFFINKNDEKEIHSIYDQSFLIIGNEAFEGTKFINVYYNGKYMPDCEYDIGLSNVNEIYTSSTYANKTFCNLPLHSKENGKGKIILITIFIIIIIEVFIFKLFPDLWNRLKI